MLLLFILKPFWGYKAICTCDVMSLHHHSSVDHGPHYGLFCDPGTRGVTLKRVAAAVWARKPGHRAKIWAGDRFPPIPKNVNDHINAWQYVDLADICQVGTCESLHPEPDPHQVIILKGVEVARPRRKPLKDIHSWVQCFTVYFAAMDKHYPDATPQLVAYMLTIMRAQWEFQEPAWRMYDEVYHEKAAARGNCKWSQMDPLLYNQEDSHMTALPVPFPHCRWV